MGVGWCLTSSVLTSVKVGERIVPANFPLVSFAEVQTFVEELLMKGEGQTAPGGQICFSHFLHPKPAASSDGALTER